MPPRASRRRRRADVGGVLSGEAIRRLVESPGSRRDPLIEPFDVGNLRAARYDVRIAADGCRTPDGTFLRVGGDRRLKGALVLESGDSAWLSTHERFCLPPDVAGSVTLKTNLANSGLLLLSGVLIDPSYGNGNGEIGDRRLRFFVANLGTDPITLVPGVTAIAAVQFVRVSGELSTTAAPASPQAMPTTGLGFVESLQHLRDGYGDLSAEVDRTRDLLRNLIVLGYFVLGTAVLSASLAAILTIATNKNLVAATRATVPDTVSGKALIAILALSVAWTFYSMALLLGPRRDVAPDVPRPHRDRRELAIRRLRARSTLWGLGILLAVPPIAALLVWSTTTDRVEVSFWPAWVLLASFAGAALLLLRHDVYAPLTEWEIRQEMMRFGAERGGSRIRDVARRAHERLGAGRARKAEQQP